MEFGLIYQYRIVCVYMVVYYFTDVDFAESFSQQIPAYKYDFDIKQYSERQIISSDFSTFMYGKDQQNKSHLKQLYKTPSSDQCFDPISRKRQKISTMIQ